MDTRKIIVIGLSKTGTRSLCQYLTNQQITAKHFPWGKEIFEGDYQAYLDIPCVAHLEQILNYYPEAKIIYTCRKDSEWLESCDKHFATTDNVQRIYYRQLVYGCLVPCKNDLLTAKSNLEEKVKSLNNLLTLDVNDPYKGEKVNEFLGLEKIIEYPHIS